MAALRATAAAAAALVSYFLHATAMFREYAGTQRHNFFTLQLCSESLLTPRGRRQWLEQVINRACKTTTKQGGVTPSAVDV